MMGNRPERNNSQQTNHNYPSDLMKYSAKDHKLRDKFLHEKTIAQLKQTSREQMQHQFYLLDSADISYQCFSTQKQQNNRYIDIFPYKHSRVKAEKVNDFHTNANYVRSIVDSNIYAIFGQAPYKQFDSFWQAVYYNNVKLITMLCAFYDTRKGPQADRYWPQVGTQQSFSNSTLIVKNKSVTEIMPNLFQTHFEIEGQQGCKQVKHLQWTNWKDLKKPVKQELQIFEYLLKESRNQIDNNRLPWIHCSAGIGRTGTFGGILDAVRYFQKNEKISVFALVENMRRYRYYAVQTFQQYEFIYHYLCDRKQ